MTEVSDSAGFVLVQWYADRSGIHNVWGPFADEVQAKAFAEWLQTAGLTGYLLESLPLHCGQLS